MKDKEEIIDKRKIIQLLKSKDIEVLKTILVEKKELNLCYNNTSSDEQIGDEEVKTLGEVLKSNTSITKLELDDNRIGDEGAKALAEALKTNTTLTELYIEQNQIGAEGARAFAAALEVNSTLTHLYLLNNTIGEGAKAIIAVLEKTNFTLTWLFLNLGNEATNEIKKKFLERNKELAKYTKELAIAQEPILKAIESENIDEVRKLIKQYHCLIRKNPEPDLIAPSKHFAIDGYISKNYFQLIGVYKKANDDFWPKLPSELKTKILSYLWPNSFLSNLSLSKVEALGIEETSSSEPTSINMLGDSYSNSEQES